MLNPSSNRGENIMILLYVILAILAVLVLILLLPVHLIVTYNEKLKIFMRIFGIKFRIKNKSKKKAKIKKQPVETKEITGKNDEKSKSLIDRIEYFLDFIKASKDFVLNILSRIKIEDLTFKLSVGGSDAFETATHYGQASSAVYSAFSAICCAKKPKNYEVSVSPDFMSGKSSLMMNLDIKLRPIYMIYFLFKYVQEIKNLKYEGDKNEWKSWKFNEFFSWKIKRNC